MAFRKRPASSGSASSSAPVTPLADSRRSKDSVTTEPDAPPSTDANNAPNRHGPTNTKRRAIGVGTTPSPESRVDAPSYFESGPSSDRRASTSSTSSRTATSATSTQSHVRRNTRRGSQSKRQNDAPDDHSRSSSSPTSRPTSAGLDDTFQGMYNAPMALIVLDEHRAIKMANGAAEGILGIASHSTGHLLERYLPPSSKQTLTLALDEASQDFAISTARLSTPLATKVEILSEEGQNTNRWADLSISAWYRSQSPLQTSSDGRDTERPPTRRAHDACFTIAISLSTQPPDEGEVKSSETKQQSRVVDEFILHRLDLAFLAVDKEGKHVGRNKAASEVWSVLKPGQDSSLDKVGLIEDERDLGWAQEVAIFYDENFEKVLSLDDLSLYKCAILGQGLGLHILPLQKVTRVRT
jgi:hypothetical protein